MCDVSKHDDDDDDDDDEMTRGSQCPVSDVIISSLRHSSCPSVSVLSRPLYIHRPFEDAPVPPQLKVTQRYLDHDKPGRDYRLQTLMVEEPRRVWLADRHYQLDSPLDNGSGSWQQLQQVHQTKEVVDDEAGVSSGDSACCDDDDVSDEQVRGVNATNDSQAEHHDVTSDVTTPCSDSNHYQPHQSRKPGLYECLRCYNC